MLSLVMRLAFHRRQSSAIAHIRASVTGHLGRSFIERTKMSGDVATLNNLPQKPPVSVHLLDSAVEVTYDYVTDGSASTLD